MNNHSFTLWLHKEVAAIRCALLIVYEQRDKLRFIDGPRLNQIYMEQVGEYENTVIKEEIECELLRSKQEKIQTALNRRESIDEAALDAEMETQRQQLIAEAVGDTEETEETTYYGSDNDELQELYREIVKNFHPQTHPELTEAHKALFQKAQEAYRLRDLEAMKLIHEMMHSALETDGLGELTLSLMLGSDDLGDNGEEVVSEKEYTTDYELTAQIYSAFKPTSLEVSIQAEQTRYRQKLDETMKDIERIRSEFPFTAEAMLSDPVQLQAYKDDLAVRLRAATQERERRTKEIQSMMESVVAHE